MRTANNPVEKWTKSLNKHFTQRMFKWPTNVLKVISIAFIVREMQIKTTKRYVYIFFRMAKFKVSDNTKCWQEHGTTRLSYIIGGNVNSYNYHGRPSWKTIMEDLYKKVCSIHNIHNSLNLEATQISRQ